MAICKDALDRVDSSTSNIGGSKPFCVECPPVAIPFVGCESELIEILISLLDDLTFSSTDGVEDRAASAVFAREVDPCISPFRPIDVLLPCE